MTPFLGHWFAWEGFGKEVQTANCQLNRTESVGQALGAEGTVKHAALDAIESRLESFPSGAEAELIFDALPDAGYSEGIDIAVRANRRARRVLESASQSVFYSEVQELTKAKPIGANSGRFAARDRKQRGEGELDRRKLVLVMQPPGKGTGSLTHLLGLDPSYLEEQGELKISPLSEVRILPPPND